MLAEEKATHQQSLTIPSHLKINSYTTPHEARQNTKIWNYTMIFERHFVLSKITEAWKTQKKKKRKYHMIKYVTSINLNHISVCINSTLHWTIKHEKKSHITNYFLYSVYASKS